MILQVWTKRIKKVINLKWPCTETQDLRPDRRNMKFSNERDMGRGTVWQMGGGSTDKCYKCTSIWGILLLSSTDREYTMKCSEEVGQYGQEFSFHPFKIRWTWELILLNYDYFFFHFIQEGEKRQD